MSRPCSLIFLQPASRDSSTPQIQGLSCCLDGAGGQEDRKTRGEEDWRRGGEETRRGRGEEEGERNIGGGGEGYRRSGRGWKYLLFRCIPVNTCSYTQNSQIQRGGERGGG